ncbi:MAG: helix-turn-helix domain-containing protein [Acidimicrobiales bacterium]
MSAPEAPPPPSAPPAPVPERWCGPTPGSYRLGYVGPGVEVWHLRCAPKCRRERWSAIKATVRSLTASAHLVGQYLTWFGNPDGSRIRVSQARIAADLGLSVGTVSRAICELEDAGLLKVRRSRWHRDSEGGLCREVNHYTLCTPPDNAEARGITGTRKRRPSVPCPAEYHRRARERAMAERRAKVEAALAAVNGSSEAQRISELPSLGAV